MSKPITYPTLAQRTPYCAVSDVQNLIGLVSPFASFTTAQIDSAIAAAQKYIDGETKSFFSPRRVIQRYDGNGQSTMNTGYSNLIVVNQLTIFYSYPAAFARVAQDHDLIFDGPQRKSGELNFPVYSITPAVIPLAYTFPQSLKNISLDAWFGPTEFESGEELATTDHQTYTFANPTVVMQSTQPAYTYVAQNPPTYYPIIYKNGVQLTNTTYEIVQTEVLQNGTPVNEWQITEDNIYYTVNYGPNGGVSITFNTPNASTDVITADYVYTATPADINEACAKKAAITLLQAAGTSGNLGTSFEGIALVQIDGSRMQYQDGLPWGGVIKQWQADIAAVIGHNKTVQMAWGMGSPRNWRQTIW